MFNRSPGLVIMYIEYHNYGPIMNYLLRNSFYWLQVPSKYDAILCFAPGVPDGYGCCYNPMPNQINYCVSAWNSSPETSAAKYGKAVEQALIDAHDLLLRSQNMSKL